MINSISHIIRGLKTEHPPKTGERYMYTFKYFSIVLKLHLKIKYFLNLLYPLLFFALSTMQVLHVLCH